MKYKIKTIANQYGIDLPDLYNAINYGTVSVDEQGYVLLDASLNSFGKRYKEMKFNLPKSAVLHTDEQGGKVYSDQNYFYAIRPDYTLLKTTDMMTAQRFITIKENPKTTYANITLSNLELIALLNYPYIDKFPGLREKLNKGLKETS